MFIRNITKSTTPSPYHLRDSHTLYSGKAKKIQQKSSFVPKFWTLASQNFKNKPPGNPTVPVDQSKRFYMLFFSNHGSEIWLLFFGCRSVVLLREFLGTVSIEFSLMYLSFFGGSHHIETAFLF